jgi:hypothetical protein
METPADFLGRALESQPYGDDYVAGISVKIGRASV